MVKSVRARVCQITGLFLLSSYMASAAGQSHSLALSSGTVAAGGSVSLNLTFSSGTGTPPAGIQWTLTYASSAVASMSVVAGPGAITASKSISCAAVNGGYACLAMGINAKPLQDGTVAVVNVSVPANFQGVTIGVSNPVAVAAAGTILSLTGTAGTVAPATTPVHSTAVFTKIDTATLGYWRTAYGAEGFNVAGDVANYPSNVAVTSSGSTTYAWAASTSDVRALQKASVATDRIAATWYSAGAFTIDLSYSDTKAHQAAIYLLDWDHQGRTERIDILDTTNAVLDSRTISNFGNGVYLVWNVSGHVSLRITNTSASNAVLSGIFLGGAAGPASGSAVFLTTDTTTQGSWKHLYGADGYNVVNDAAKYPGFATVTTPPSSSTWAATTTDVRGLQKTSASNDRIAAAWNSSTSFNIDLNFTDGNTHQVAVYLVDWDGLNSRKERLDVVDASNTVLDTRSIASFSNGLYLVWNLSGHLTLRVTNTGTGSAVLSGIFFGLSSNQAAGSASFTKLDRTTKGSWANVYGNDGYNVVTQQGKYPAYVTPLPAGYSSYTWADSTTDVRALQKAPLKMDRVAATWYSSASFTIDLNFKDTISHQVAIYLLDWENGGRTERVDVLDANNTPLDTRTVAVFNEGLYLAWNMSGHTVIRITNTNAAANAVLSGIFFAPAAVPGTGFASYQKTDTTTHGSWKGIYGATGYEVARDVTADPSYAIVNNTALLSYVWTASTSDVRALLKAASPNDRIAGCWYSPASFDIQLNFQDANAHEVALYLLDWNSEGRTQRIDIWDLQGNLLDTRTAAGFGGGQYLVWKISGQVLVHVTNTNPASNAVISGLFFK